MHAVVIGPPEMNHRGLVFKVNVAGLLLRVGSAGTGSYQALEDGVREPLARSAAFDAVRRYEEENRAEVLALYARLPLAPASRRAP